MRNCSGRVRLHRVVLIVMLWLFHAAAWGESRETLSLNGRWHFALDPLKLGDRYGWHLPETKVTRWDEVEVPHCWPVDPRYQYTGTAWYRRTFDVPRSWESKHVRLRFGAVFYKARVWINGELAGEHEGGYTPFVVEATAFLRFGQSNAVVVAVNNEWSLDSLPGARPLPEPHYQVYPWWNYGGIVRPVTLEATPLVFVRQQKVEPEVHLEGPRAQVRVRVWVSNVTDEQITVSITGTLQRWSAEGLREVPGLSKATTQTKVPPQGSVEATLDWQLEPGQVELWNLNRPALYVSQVEARPEGGDPELADVHSARFGLRRVEVRSDGLYLNGELIRLAGANRPSDHPLFGLIEPDEVVHRDLELMKQAGLRLARDSLRLAREPARLGR